MVVERIATSTDPGTDPTNFALEIDNSVGVEVRECLFQYASSGLKIDGCEDVTVEANQFVGAAGKIDASQSRNLQILGNEWTADQDGTVIDVWNCTGTVIEDNDILIETGQTGGNSLEFAIVVIDRDDAGDQPATVLRGNRIDTNEAGIQARVFGQGSRVEVERNFVDVGSEQSRKAFEVYSGSNQPGQTLLVRNNVFEQTTAFAAIYLRDADQFESIELINNTLRVSPTVSTQPSNWAVGIATTAAVSGPLPIRLVNNVLVGNGAEGISIPNGATIDADYNLFWGFSANYTDGTTSTGTHDLTGDPTFVDEVLRVAADSPAVDSGATIAEVPTVPPDDFSSAARPQGSGVDRGAHER
jgi:hypothetical protein